MRDLQKLLMLFFKSVSNTEERQCCTKSPKFAQHLSSYELTKFIAKQYSNRKLVSVTFRRDCMDDQMTDDVVMC